MLPVPMPMQNSFITLHVFLYVTQQYFSHISTSLCYLICSGISLPARHYSCYLEISTHQNQTR